MTFAPATETISTPEPATAEATEPTIVEEPTSILKPAQEEEPVKKEEEHTTAATENPVTEQTIDIPVASHAAPQPIAV
ncbi:MAG: hypothetical protein CL912_18360 [Deltaproteobacteria bacterium]|nr:hypothetical protein [Deltaproteobacteria bacterium]